MFNSIIARSPLVELVPYADAPSEDAFVLTDAGAEAIRAEVEEGAEAARWN